MHTLQVLSWCCSHSLPFSFVSLLWFIGSIFLSSLFLLPLWIITLILFSFCLCWWIIIYFFKSFFLFSQSLLITQSLPRMYISVSPSLLWCLNPSFCLFATLFTLNVIYKWWNTSCATYNLPPIFPPDMDILWLIHLFYLTLLVKCILSGDSVDWWICVKDCDFAMLGLYANIVVQA